MKNLERIRKISIFLDLIDKMQVLNCIDYVRPT